MTHARLTSFWSQPVRPGPVPPRVIGNRPPRYKQRTRKIPTAIRAQLYQLELAIKETDAEIRRIYDSYGFSKQGRNAQRVRIVEERGL